MKNIERWLFLVFLSLFLFAVFNRELSFFGIDMRFIVLGIGILLGGVNLFHYVTAEKHLRNTLAAIDKLVVAFLSLSLIANIAWLWNGLEIQKQPFLAVAFACGYHLAAYLLFVINRQYLHWRTASLVIAVSGAILVTSMLTSYVGVDLRTLGSSYPGGYTDRLAPSFISENRYGGYAQDPNYATLFMVIWSAVAVYNFAKTRRKYWLIVLPFALFGVLISASKSIILMLPVALILALLRPGKVASTAKHALLTLVFAATILFAFTNIKIGDVQTLNTRIGLWNAASSAIEKSPLIGNGLTAARSAAAETKWYVQPHSSIIQILVDMGVLGVLLIFAILSRNLFSPHRLVVFLTVVFLSHFLTHETIYQAYFLFIIALLPLFMQRRSEEYRRESADIYVINTLSNGGAERVVQNMANSSKSNAVYIFTLHQTDRPSYRLNSNVTVVNLGGGGGRWQAPILAARLSQRLTEITKDYDINLATTHLPFAHLVTRMTRYSSRFIYVMHGMYGVNHSGLSGAIVKLMYYRQSLVAVSKGFMRGDIMQKYGLKPRNITTIYNPIDFSHIDERLSPLAKKRKEIVFVGRLSPQKNPTAAVEAFAASGLAADGYKLIMLGDGELRREVESNIKHHDLEKSVELTGFVDNPFAVMQRAKMLVIASEYEAFTMVALEALYCECPVVAYDIDYGIDELLTGELSRFIAPRGDEKAMGRVMKKAATQYPGELREHVVGMVEPKKIMQQYYKTYKEWTR